MLRAGSREKGPLGYFEWSAPPDAAREDRAGWAAANPALGHTLDEATIVAELATDPAPVFETEVLCRRVTAVASWLPAGRWEHVGLDDRSRESRRPWSRVPRLARTLAPPRFFPP